MYLLNIIIPTTYTYKKFKTIEYIKKSLNNTIKLNNYINKNSFVNKVKY